MFGIPEWAIGVGVIILFGAAGLVLMVRFLPPEIRRREVERRLSELDEVKQRVAELEERVDFAERLLAKHREGERLAPPQG